MQKKTLLMALILIIMISIATCVNAATWGGSTTVSSTVNYTRTITGATLSMTYGEVDGYGNLITRLSIPLSSNESQSGTIKAGCPANHYSMSLVNADSNGIITGLDTTSTTNGGEKLIVNALKTGTQTIHIITNNTSTDWPEGVNTYDNVVTVIAYYSNNFQAAAGALDITFNENKTVYYDDNINIYPENNDKFEAIINAKSKYEALNPYEKARLDAIISSKSNGTYANYTALYNAADAYLTELARTFITSTSVNGLKGNTVANKNNCETIINAQTEYNGLKNIVKDRVNLLLTSAPSAQYSGYSSVDYPTLLENAQAHKFIKTYDIDTPDVNLSKTKDEKILDSEINSEYKYSDLDSGVKAKVDLFLNSEVGRNYETQIAYVRNHLEQTLADSFVDNTFLSDYEDLAGTKSLRNYNKNTELDQEATDMYEDLANKIIGDVDTEYNSIISNQYVNEDSLKQKIDNAIVNSDYNSILAAAEDYLADLEAARDFVEEHKLNDDLTVEIAEDIITLENAISDARVQAMVEEIIGETMEEKIQEADDFLTGLADKFIEDNELNKEFTKSSATNIVNNLKDNYDNISSNIVKDRVDQKLEKTIDEIIEDAQEFLDETEANEFIEENKLDEELTKQIASNILKLGDKFDNLSNDNVKAKVLEKLGVEDFDEVIEKAQEYLDTVAAQEFYDNYLDGLVEEKIVAGKDAWSNSSTVVQDKINKLLNDHNVKETYPELLKNAIDALNEKAAQEFINNNLTKDSEVIKEANTSNAKQIINAEEAYNLLSDEVKAKVNAKLKEVSNTTYPELLKAAQDLQKNPKTGDLSRIMIVVFVISILGMIATRRKRK